MKLTKSIKKELLNNISFYKRRIHMYKLQIQAIKALLDKNK